MNIMIRGRRNLQNAARWLQLITLALMASACANLSSGPWFSSSTETPENYSVHAYYSWLESADAEQIEKELARLESRDGDVTRDVQLALAYSVPGDVSNERELQAIDLLSTIAPQNSVRFDQRAGGYRDFAQIWRDVLQQRQSLRSAETELVEALKVQNRQLQEQSGRLEEQNRELQEQIDALTNIEQQLIEREQSQGR